MTALTKLLATCNAFGIRLQSTGDGGLIIDGPQEAVTPDLLDRLKAHKREILALLSPLTLEDRRAGYERAVAEATRLYRGGPIDWPAVDAAAERIFTAQTREQLHSAGHDYVDAVTAPTATTHQSEDTKHAV